MSRVMFDSFSGPASDLKPKDRTIDALLRTLAKQPRVSVWDMSELGWLRLLIADAMRAELIRETGEPYPWLRFVLTDKGAQTIGQRVALVGLND